MSETPEARVGQEGVRRLEVRTPSLKILQKYGLVVSLLIIVLALSLLSRNFFTLPNIMNILLQSSNIGIMAAGTTLVMIVGEIDLSIGSVEALGAVTVALCLKYSGLGIIPSILVALLVGSCIGGLSGFFTAKFLIPAFIVTLAMDSVARGTALIISKEESIYGLPTTFGILGQGYFGPVPLAPIIAAVFFLVAHILLTKTRFGINVYAVGGNKEAARIAGINVGLVKAVVLILSGFTAASAGVIMASRLNSAQAILGVYDLLQVIAAVVIGGASLMGGEGTVFGTIIGTLVIAVIRNGLDLLGVPPDWQLLAVGTVILLAVLIDYVGRR